MDTGFLLFLLGAGALAVLSDMFVSSNSATEAAAEPAMPKEEEDISAHRVILGTEENDRFDSQGGETIFGLGGDDVLVTYGDSTFFGGDGDDVLVSVGGGAVLNGGAGADIFRIELLGVRDDGTLLDFYGQPVAPTVIADFNPESDQLVLDLLDSTLLPNGSGPVVLTGIPAPDGEGLMVQVDGVNVVQLSSYGGGDMQAALEDLVNAFDALEIVGAALIFPETPPAIPLGVDVQQLPATPDQIWGEQRFIVTDDYAGGGELNDFFGLNPVLDLSQFSGNVVIMTNAQDIMTLQVTGTDLAPTVLININSIILGPGENEIYVSRMALHVTATEGTNTITNWRGTLDLTLEGGRNSISMFDDGIVRAQISGGDNAFTNSDGITTFVTMAEGATGNTSVVGGGTVLRFMGDTPSLTVTLAEDGGAVAAWDGGALDVDRVNSLTVGNGATVDASARDPSLLPATPLISDGPDSTVIGSAGPDSMFGQGSFFGGDGDDAIEVDIWHDGGARVDGGAGDDVIGVLLTNPWSGDVVLTGGEGRDEFVITVDYPSWTGVDSVVRITDLEDDERIRVYVDAFFATPDMPQIPITIIEDADANEVRILLDDRPFIILENRASLAASALTVRDVSGD
jgi:hypothetical protein